MLTMMLRSKMLMSDCRYVTIALAIAHYYWTRGNKETMPRFPVLHAVRTTLRSDSVWCHLTSHMSSVHTVRMQIAKILK